MATSRQVSVFDIIGPIMVGPSSSHTAGAVRLGRIARTILGIQPDDALIELHGSFAQTGQGHGTHKAMVAGLLDMPADDDRIPHSFAVAAEMGMDFSLRNRRSGRGRSSQHGPAYHQRRESLGQSHRRVRGRGDGQDHQHSGLRSGLWR